MNCELLELYVTTHFRGETFELFDCFAIVTACNPLGKQISVQTNQQMNSRLQDDIKGYRYYPVEAGSPDFSYIEASFCIECSNEQAKTLARRYKQNAIFWVEKGVIYLQAVCTKFETCVLPEPFSQRFSLK